MLIKEAMKSPFLELFKTQLDEFTSNWPCFDQRLNCRSPFQPGILIASNLWKKHILIDMHNVQILA